MNGVRPLVSNTEESFYSSFHQDRVVRCDSFLIIRSALLPIKREYCASLSRRRSACFLSRESVCDIFHRIRKLGVSSCQQELLMIVSRQGCLLPIKIESHDRSVERVTSLHEPLLLRQGHDKQAGMNAGIQQRR